MLCVDCPFLLVVVVNVRKFFFRFYDAMRDKSR